MYVCLQCLFAVVFHQLVHTLVLTDIEVCCRATCGLCRMEGTCGSRGFWAVWRRVQNHKQ